MIYDIDVLSKIPTLPAIVSQVVKFDSNRTLKKSLQVISDKIADALSIPKVTVKLVSKPKIKDKKEINGNFLADVVRGTYVCKMIIFLTDVAGEKYSGLEIYKTACHEWQHWIDTFKLGFIFLSRTEFEAITHNASFFKRCRQLEERLMQV